MVQGGILLGCLLLLGSAMGANQKVRTQRSSEKEETVIAADGVARTDVATPVSVGRVSLGKVETSRIALGGLHFPELSSPEALRGLLGVALENGITLLDLADIYGYNKSAELVGKAFALEPGLRERFQIVYKTGIVFPEQPQHLDNSAEYLRRAVSIATTQLQTSYIDVLMLHAPDPLLDAAELAGAFKELKQAEKVKAFGVSNFPPEKLELVRAAFEKEGLELSTAEFEISVLTPTSMFDGRLDQAQRLGMHPLGWGPLGGDPMAGVNRLFNFDGDRQVRIRNELKKVAAELGAGVTEDQVAIAWLLRHPAQIVPILGTVKEDRLSTQAKAVTLNLTRSQWTRILGASAVSDYKRWEQMNDGEWHDVAMDYQKNTYGTRLGVDVPLGFCDFDSCKMP